MAFRLFSSAGSFFYMNGLAEQNLKTICGHLTDDQSSIAGYLNPRDASGTYADATFPGGIFWREV